MKIQTTGKAVPSKTVEERVIKAFRKEFVQNHNIGEERFLRGLFIEDFEDFLRKQIPVIQEEAVRENNEKIKRNIDFVRQWLNENRITESKMMVTNEELEMWLEVDLQPKAGEEEKE